MWQSDFVVNYWCVVLNREKIAKCVTQDIFLSLENITQYTIYRYSYVTIITTIIIAHERRVHVRRVQDSTFTARGYYNRLDFWPISLSSSQQGASNAGSHTAGNRAYYYNGFAKIYCLNGTLVFQNIFSTQILQTEASFFL